MGVREEIEAEFDAVLDRVAHLHGVSRSDVLRRALAAADGKEQAEPMRWEVTRERGGEYVARLIGGDHSGEISAPSLGMLEVTLLAAGLSPLLRDEMRQFPGCVQVWR